MAASLTLQQMRDLARLTLDLEAEDLPDQLIDSWAQEGFDIIIEPERNWDFYQIDASLSTVANQQKYALSTIVQDAAIRDIYAVRGPHWDLYPVSQRLAESAFNRTTVTVREPNYYSQWDDSLYFWPTPDATYSLEVRGYRNPLDWITLGGSGAIPDCPAVFHRTILAWVLSRTYSQQDDPGTAQQFEQQFANQLRILQQRHTKAPSTGPFLLNQGEIQGGPLGRLRFDWE